MNPKKVYDQVKQSGKNWWIFLILGILAIGAGSFMLFSPLASAVIATYLFASYFLISGLVDMVNVITYRNDIPAWGWPLVGAILMILFGALLLTAPYFAAGLMTFVFAFGIIFMGINFIAGIALIDGALGKVLMVLLGILVIISGAFCINNPLSGLFTIATLEALSMFFSGVACIVLSIELSKINSIRKKLEAQQK